MGAKPPYSTSATSTNPSSNSHRPTGRQIRKRLTVNRPAPRHDGGGPTFAILEVPTVPPVLDKPLNAVRRVLLAPIPDILPKAVWKGAEILMWGIAAWFAGSCMLYVYQTLLMDQP